MKLLLVALALCVAVALAHPHPNGGGEHEGGWGRHHPRDGEGDGDEAAPPAADADDMPPAPPAAAPVDLRQCRACNYITGEVFCGSDNEIKFDSDGVCQRAELPCSGVKVTQAALCPADVPRSKRSCTLCVMDGYVWVPSDSSSEYAGKCVSAQDISTQPPVPSPPHRADPPADGGFVPPPPPPPSPPSSVPTGPSNPPAAPPAADPAAPPAGSEAPPAAPTPVPPAGGQDDIGGDDSGDDEMVDLPANGDRNGEDDHDAAPRPQHREHDRKHHGGGRRHHRGGDSEMPAFVTSAEQCQQLALPPAYRGIADGSTPQDGWRSHHGGRHHRFLFIASHAVGFVFLLLGALCVVRCIRKRVCRRRHGHHHGSGNAGVPASSPSVFVETVATTSPAPSAPPAPVAPAAPAAAPVAPAPMPSYVYPGAASVPVSIPYAAYYPVNQYAQAQQQQQLPAPVAPVYPAVPPRTRNGYSAVAQNDD